MHAVPSAAPRLGLGLDSALVTTPPGVVELPAAASHRIKIHAGAPTRGACRDGRFVYTRGDIDLFPAGASDVWHEEDTNTSLVVELAPALLRRVADDLGLGDDRGGLAQRCHIKDERIEHIAWAIDLERRAGRPNGMLYTESLGIALAVHLLGNHAAPRVRDRGLSAPQLRRVTSYIAEHLDGDLSLAKLAALVDVSASHFKTMFRRATGVPVHRYVVERRVERARQELLRGELSISQVALDAGFAHASHMARCMRRVLGVTPAALRRSLAA